MPENAHNAAIARAIIALAHSLGLRVIAEGVETQRQWQFLLESSCEEIQGFIVSRALPPEDFARFVARSRDAIPAAPLAVAV